MGVLGAVREPRVRLSVQSIIDESREFSRGIAATVLIGAEDVLLLPLLLFFFLFLFFFVIDRVCSRQFRKASRQIQRKFLDSASLIVISS